MPGGPAWPVEAKFGFGQFVQRGNMPNGNPPAYRFPGHVVGWYRSSMGGLGYVVNSAREPGCIQIFTEKMLMPIQPEDITVG